MTSRHSIRLNTEKRPEIIVIRNGGAILIAENNLFLPPAERLTLQVVD